MELGSWLVTVATLLLALAFALLIAVCVRQSRSIKQLYDVLSDHGVSLHAIVSSMDKPMRQRYASTMDAMDEARHGRK